MPNPVRKWQNFLTAWEKLDEAAHQELIYKTKRHLVKLRAQRKDIEGRIKYWEDSLEKSQEARRLTEQKARGRERQDCLGKELPG